MIKKEPLKRINIPSVALHQEEISHQEIEKEAKKRVSRIAKEFANGFEFIRSYPKSVTFFGSARFSEHNPYYKKARHIAQELSKQGYAIVTGGGPGIMEAGNRGARDENGESVGLNIKLPMEQVLNPYVKNHLDFHYFFSRKVCMSFSAEAYLYFPGGFGTLDELFEILTLVQTHKIRKVPIILVGEKFWKPLDHFLDTLLYHQNDTIEESDLDLYTITDDEALIMKIVAAAPSRGRHKDKNKSK